MYETSEANTILKHLLSVCIQKKYHHVFSIFYMLFLSFYARNTVEI